MTEQIKKICAWHKQYFGFELVMENGIEPATHGMCKQCAKIAMERILKPTKKPANNINRNINQER